MNYQLSLKIAVGVLFYAALSGTVMAQDKPADQRARNYHLALHDTPEEKQRFRDYQVTIQDRNNKIGAAIITIETHDGSPQTWNGPVSTSILLLREFRADEAAPTLAKKLTFTPLRARVEYTESVPWEFYYPAARALARIGIPSQTPGLMVNVLSKSTNKLERDLAVWVLMEIFGKEAAEALLLKEEKNIHDTERKQALHAAVEYLRTYKVKFGRLDR